MAMLILSTGVRDKAAVSSLVNALDPLMTSSAHLLPVLALLLVVVVEAALPMLALITASGSTLAIPMIAIILMLTHMLDSPASKASEETLVQSALPVPLIPRVLDLKPLSALNTPAVDLVVTPSLLLILAISLLLAPGRVE